MPSTPLLKQLKENGSTFYAMPSTSMHPNPSFSKFVLLNIPNKIEDKRMDFEEENFNGSPFEIYTDNIDGQASYSDSLIESFRNYVANHDTIMRDSRISSTKDFYNIDEKQTPTEMIFWKWLKKMKAIDFEVAKHAVDWDKNMTDFENPNADTISNTDYFRKYLWSERQVIQYPMETVSDAGGNVVEVIISYNAKFRIDDEIIFKFDVNDSFGTEIKSGTAYPLTNVIEDSTNNETKLYFKLIDSTTVGTVSEPIGTVELNYQQVVNYIGEINATSDVKTSRKDEVEVTAYIPHQAGSTPSILFSTRTDENYYPNVELPILASQIQSEIKGAENLDSPIRQNPGDYPGLYYGQFDTSNKTYQAKSGDKIRYSGEYYGILSDNNVGVDADDYTFLMSDFDSTTLDGINIDFDLEHYLKMSITDEQVGFNFDEFNQISIDNEDPSDFEYNAILWYYEVDGDDVNDSNIYTNLYGITFLNNPKNNTSDNTYIQPYQKLVSTDEHDGLSYIHNLNISTSVDNDTSSMSFDPLSLNNAFGFDLYSNVMSNVAKLNESFISIITSFTTMNEELNNMKSLIYTQTDINLIKSKILNLEELLKLYEQYQFVDSDTVSIISNFGGVYPTLSFKVKSSEYSEIYNINASDIKNYLDTTGDIYQIEVPDSNKLLVKVTNDDITDYTTDGEDVLKILLDKDLEYKQVAEIYVDSDNSYYTNRLDVNINFYDSVTDTHSEKTIINDLYLPTDIGVNITDNIIYNRAYYNDTFISQNINLMKSDGVDPVFYTILYPSEQNIMGSSIYDEKIFIENFKFTNNTTGELVDYAGVYTIGISENDFNQVYFKIELNTYGYTLVSIPKVFLPKAIKYTITRIDESDSSSITDRYLLQKQYI